MVDQSHLGGGITTTHDVTGEYEVTVTTAKHIALLLGGGADSRRIVLEALSEGFEIFHTEVLDQSREAVRQCAPDVVILDAGPREAEVLERLGADPLTDSIPVVALSGPDETPPASDLVREASGRLVRPFEAEALRYMAQSMVTGPHGGLPAMAGRLDQAPLPEVLEFVNREIEFGVLNAIGPGAHERTLLPGRELELLRELGAFIARVRELFVVQPVTREADAAARVDVVAIPDQSTTDDVERYVEPDRTVEVDDGDVVSETPSWVGTLGGARAVVADDDPEIRQLFKSALGAFNAQVELVESGRAALDAAHRVPPDVVITDIVMPEMDGWELIGRLRREVLLWDIPVVVLSWREDFLQRMRELGANAAQYIVKEASISRILESVSAALAGRRQMEKLLEKGDEAVGRVEVIGVVPLLRLITRLSRVGGVHLTVRETWNLHQVELSRGRVVHADATTTSGHRLEGLDALTTLLGVRGGRFSVHHDHEPLTSAVQITGSLEDILERAAAPLQSLIDAVSLGRVLDVSHVELDEAILPDYLEVAPRHIKEVVERLGRGEAPRDALFQGRLSPRELETVVVDMIRRGVITAVE